MLFTFLSLHLFSDCGILSIVKIITDLRPIVLHDCIHVILYPPVFASDEGTEDSLVDHLAVNTILILVFTDIVMLYPYSCGKGSTLDEQSESVL